MHSRQPRMLHSSTETSATRARPQRLWILPSPASVSTTLAGFLYVSQLAVKRMLQQKSGSIVNVSTALVDQPIAGVPVAVQVMAKGSLHAVTRALAIEYAKDGIRV